MRTFFKIVLIILTTIIVLICGLAAFIHHEISDEQLRKHAESFLSEALGTEVKLEGARLHPFESEMAIYGLNVKDLQKEDMLHIDTLEATVNFWKLWKKEVLVYGFNLSGANANIYKVRKDSAANYQFVIDAIQFVGEKKDTIAKKDTKNQLYFDLRKVTINRTSAKWDVRSEDSLYCDGHKELDPNHLWIDNLHTRVSLHGGGAPGNFTGKMDLLAVNERNSETAITLKDIVFKGNERKLGIGDMDFTYQDKHLAIKDYSLEGSTEGTADVHHLVIKNIYFKNGIGVPVTPRRPMEGEFDGEHLELELSLDATASILSADSVDMKINSLKGVDKTSGLHIDSMSVDVNGTRFHQIMNDLYVCSGKTEVIIDSASINLPRYGKDKRPLSFATSEVKVNALLKDIARPFGQALINFTTPLFARCSITGDEKQIKIHNVHAYNADHRVDVHADGVMNIPQKKGEQMSLRFNVHKLKAVRGIKEQIISHFPIQGDAMKFIRDLGDISFRGTVYLPFRRQDFKGVLGTRWGVFDVNMKLSSIDYKLNGSLSTQKFNLGKYIGNDNIGNISVMANISDLDIASPQIAKLIHRKQGLIPTCTLSGRAREASYKGIKIRDIDFKIHSNGKAADGKLWATNKWADLSCDFSFTDPTDIKNTLKVKPHIKLHKLKLFEKKSKKDKTDKKDKK